MAEIWGRLALYVIAPGRGLSVVLGARRVSVAIGLLVAVLAAAGIVLASLFLDGAWETALITVLSVALSIGLISLIYEVWLRDVVTHELLDLLLLQKTTAESGLKEIGLTSRTDWARMFLDSRDFILLPRDIPSFASREWFHVLSAGRSRKIDVHLLLPDTSASAFPILEASLGAQADTLGRAVTDARELMLKAWDSAERGQPALMSGSKLAVYEYDDFPGCAVFITDSEIAIELSSALANRPGDEGCVLTFDAKQPSPHVKGLGDQVKRACAQDKMVDLREVD